MIDPGARRVGAFVIVTMFLVIASDYESTGQLAVAFAYLILLSALFSAGPKAFDRLTAVANGKG